jgi:hypothetical protein
VEKKCEECGAVFSRSPSAMVGAKYCSIKCRNENKNIYIKCAWCGADIKRKKSRGCCTSIFCNKKCYDSYQRKNMVEMNCECCGALFVLSAKNTRFCSNACAHNIMSGESHPSFVGGATKGNDGSCNVLFKRKNLKGRYVRTHRMAVEEILGKVLLKNNHVIHLNRCKEDNRPENLYVCDSISECQKIVKGSLPFPNSSNIKEYLSCC